ncbi:MAG: ribosome maturation factor RimM [Candidatus Krumholzibacteriia bacterium]
MLGQFVKAIGLHGELKLRESEDFWEKALGSVRLSMVRESEDRPARVRRARVHKAGVRGVFLEGVEDREGAEALVGTELVIDIEALDVAGPPTPRPFQVRGVKVLLPDGTALGHVERLLVMPAHDVFVVRGESKEYLIPDAPHVIEELDLAAKVMRIRPLPGLLEL